MSTYQPSTSTRLLQEPNAQLEPYFPLPARFGPWLAWAASLIGIGSLLGAALSVYITEPAPGRYRLSIIELASHSPARHIIGVGLCLLGFVSFVVSWSVFHSLELRLQGISNQTSAANKLTYRLGSLAAVGLFVSGSIMQVSGVSPPVLVAVLTGSGAVVLTASTVLTVLINSNQSTLIRNSRDFFWLRVKKGALVSTAIMLIVRCVRAAAPSRFAAAARGRAWARARACVHATPLSPRLPTANCAAASRTLRPPSSHPPPSHPRPAPWAASRRLVLSLSWASMPDLLVSALDDCVFSACCVFLGTLCNELR
jgi:hypothetical protein